MAEVPTSLLDELTDEVNKLSGDAQEKTRAALKTLIADWEKHGGGDVATLRNAAYETIEAVLLYYADTCAAARAAEYYDAVRQAQGFSGGYSAVAESMRDPDATLGAVKYFVGKVVEGAPEAFVSLCVKRIDEEIRRAANRCVAHNARKDPAKPRYARVPRGETCGFCLMLASFGFNAKTEEAASHSHAHCDCRIVPGFDGKTKVRGYDPDGMYERYNECLAALGGRNGISSDWYAMPREDREAFIKRHGGSNSKALKAYTNSRISSEIGTRDPRWFKTGKKPMVTKENGAKPLRKEKDVCEHLSENGYSVKFLKEVNKNGVKTPDAILGDAAWEFKIPEGYNGEHTVRNQFYKALGKGTPRLLISCTENHAPADEVAEWVIETFKKGDYDYITEVLVMADDGSLRRLKRP